MRQSPVRPARAAPLVDVAIIGEDGKRLPDGEVGEIAIRSAANIKCYWRNPEATAALFTADGFVRTGDLGYLDEDGYLFIVDRKKDIIIRGGENISAAEVEAEVYACPAVAEVSVFGAPDERLGEVPIAIVLAKDGERLSEEQLRSFLDGRLAKFKIPAADHLRRRAPAQARHRQDRPPRAQGAVRPLKVDRRAVLVGGGAGIGLIVAFALWPRHMRSDLALERGETGVRQFHQDCARWSHHRRRPSGRDRSRHLDRPSPNRRRRAWRGMGDDRRRAGAADRRLRQPVRERGRVAEG